MKNQKNYRFDEETKRLDVYDLINSKDIAEHCRNIRHEFDTVETAVIIHRCNKLTLDEKIECFNILIEHYDDMEVLKRTNCGHYDSVKTLLKNRIGYFNKLVEIFEKEEDGCIYTVGVVIDDCDGFSRYYTYTTKSFDKAIQYSKNQNSKNQIKKLYRYNSNNIKNAAYNICKEWLDDEEDKRGYFEFNENDERISFSNFNFLEAENVDELDGIWINIPTPFKKGDILVEMNDTVIHGIGVLDWLCNQDEKYVSRHLQHDGTDMTARLYFIHEDKDYYGDDDVRYETTHNYDDLEYCRVPLEGKYRLLKPISSLMKGEIMIDLFIRAVEVIRAQLAVNKLQYTPFSDDDLKLAELIG